MKNLLKLSRDTIPKFLELYKGASYPRHALTRATFQNYLIQTDKFPEYRNSIEIFALNSDWQKDGLFLMKNGPIYFFDSLEPKPFDRVKELLLNIDYSKEVVFQAVRDQFKPMINDVLWLKNLEITDQTGTTIYYLTKDFIMQLPEPVLPEGWKFRNLTLDDVPEINQKLLREGGDNIGYLETTIKYKLSLGIVDENGKIQAWLYGVDIGAAGSLGVTEGHKQKGTGSALTVKFAKTLLTDSDVDYTFNVAHGNDAAHALFLRFQCKPIGTVTWMAVNKRVSSKMTKMGMYQIFYPIAHKL